MGFSLDTLDPSLQCQGTRMNSLSIKEQAAQTVLKEVNELNRRKEQQTSQRLKRAEQYRIDNERASFQAQIDVLSEKVRKLETVITLILNPMAEAGASDSDETTPTAMAAIDSPTRFTSDNDSQSSQATTDAENTHHLSITKEDPRFSHLSSDNDFKKEPMDEVFSVISEPGSVRTLTYYGFKYIVQGPASLMAKDDGQEQLSMSKSVLPVEDGTCSTLEQSSDNDHSGPDDLTKPEFSAPSLIDVRTFTNEFIYVGKSKIKDAGFGMFAAKDIKDGEHILLEHHMLRTSTMDLFKNFEKLEKQEQELLLSLAGFHPRHDADPIERMFNANAFQTTDGDDVVCPIASSFNHACKPKNNVGYIWDKNRKLMVFTAIKDVPAHEELLITYGKERYGLMSRFGFICDCGVCYSTFTLEPDY